MMRQLYAAQKIFKITDHYVVTDEGGYTVYQVDENYRVLGKNMNVTNVETGVQFTLERQLGLGTVFNVGFSTGDQLHMRKRFKLAGLNIEAYLNQTRFRSGVVSGKVTLRLFLKEVLSPLFTSLGLRCATNIRSLCTTSVFKTLLLQFSLLLIIYLISGRRTGLELVFTDPKAPPMRQV